MIIQAISKYLTKHNTPHRKYTNTIYHSNEITGYATRIIQLNTNNTIQITRYNTPNPLTLELADPELLPKILQAITCK
jgi:hypothetical protein